MEELRQATNNFDMDNTIGHGSHGTVYTGLIKDMPVVIKREWCSPQPRFLDEVHTNKKLVSYIQHKNLVNLLGYCCDDENQSLVFEYMVNGSVRDYLESSDLTFKKRISIALDAAKGLLHLHNLDPPVQHKRFTASKVLLDANLNAKVSDGAMLGLLQASDIHLANPRGGSEETIDVYSFGLFLLELITCQNPGLLQSDYEVLQWISPRLFTNTFWDKNIPAETFTRPSFQAYLIIMSECLEYPPINRPKMDVVVTELETIYLNVISENHEVSLGSELFNITIE
ncbi:Protein kinase-like domain superfamily [Arabidopsis suecica]|uniref:Protein kinase-like domain superfamily n=1 Tax=Arabidopsis suecica TaxID=45249 RepID=A0A8T2F7F1_ARASU|nr:Protein kinase-like domain superfamily [Arabidopsis suecica]